MVNAVSVIELCSGYSHVMNRNNFISLRYKVSKPEKCCPSLISPELDSIVYVRHSSTGVEAFIYSDAIGEILSVLPMRWSWMRIAWIVPRSIRDVVYRAFAARRIQWFGKVDACRLPDERQSRRLLS